MQTSEPGIAIGPVAGKHAALAFEANALDDACGRLRTNGVTFASEETNHPEWGPRTAFPRDPDGNLVCLYGSLPA